MSSISTNDMGKWLKKPKFKAIWPRMGIRPLFAILIAAAMLFAPLVAGSGTAMASVPGDHHGQAMTSDHCAQPEEGDADKASDKPCCVAMCAATVIALPTEFEPQVFGRQAVRPALVTSDHSFLAELPTPPPRLG